MSLDQALEEWRALLGAEYVRDDAAACGPAATATFHTNQHVLAMIRPGTRAELQECLRIASRTATPVYPVSAGKNWGYGSRVPSSDGCVLLLDRMNRILDFDDQLAYITVEPGVTFAQVQQFLAERHASVVLAMPGSTALASLIGNALERGISSGLSSDRVREMCDLVVVLPDGNCLYTGAGQFGAGGSGRVWPHGLGPALDGLFAQSNLGVVAQATFWLAPRPAYAQLVSFAINAPERFVPLLDRLQTIKRERLLESSIGLFNAFKVLSYTRRWPAGLPQTQAVDLGDLPEEYARVLRGGEWFGETMITAPNDEIGMMQRRLLRQRLEPVVDTLSFHSPDAPNPLLGEALPDVASVYWRKRTPPPSTPDPDRDRCGVIWCSPVVPACASEIAAVVELLGSGLREFSFEPMLGVQMLSLRAVHVVAAIVYDREQIGHDKQALDCYHALLERLGAAGRLPYRLAVPALVVGLIAHDDSAIALARIKAAFDPADILAPGRYDWRERVQ